MHIQTTTKITSITTVNVTKVVGVGTIVLKAICHSSSFVCNGMGDSVWASNLYTAHFGVFVCEHIYM